MTQGREEDQGSGLDIETKGGVHKIISLIQAGHISMSFWYRNFLNIADFGKVSIDAIMQQNNYRF